MAIDYLTLNLHWAFSIITIALISTRLIWRKVAHQKYVLGDWLSVAALVCVMCRLGLIHVVLVWGTSNIPDSVRAHINFTDREIYRRVIGSKLSLVNRVFYNSYLWLQKCVLLDVYQRLLHNVPWRKTALWVYLTAFFGTYVACQVTTFSECSPVKKYWQIVPSAGSCTEAQLQLVVVGVTNIVTDFMLLLLPIPLLVGLQTNFRLKFQLGCLFALGSFIIAITVIRLPINALNKSMQSSRSTWASVELFTSALVVNAPTIYGLWNKRRQASKPGSSTPQSGAPFTSGTRRTAHGSHLDYTTNVEAERFEMGNAPAGPINGIMQTKEVLVSELSAVDAKVKGYNHLDDSASSISSQKHIIR
ncbi:hypothetical protein TD95_005287 [Thielaviopsis punctulata]|uniref:Rhodopsin domain-containing protein n=1 Tax=Thielaviopsis punctulata TaxID=72032 RepID=A0A0F4ZLS3_9PEZI|nr:hypothetical protein TD95_005287 [Thielaviopsis punctulata]